MSTIFYPASIWLPILTPALLVAIVGLCLSVNLRLVFVAVGGFFILDSSAKFDAPKMVYLAGYALAFGIAVLDWRKSSSSDRPLVVLAIALFSLVTLSMPVALINRTPMLSWLRDAASMVFVASTPIFALDARKLRSPLILLAIFVMTGLIGSLMFAYEMLHRYSGDAGGAHASGLVSLFLPVALFLYSTSELIVGKHFRAGWAVISISVLALMLLSGSRGMLTTLFIPLAMIIVGLRPSWRHLVKYTLESVVVTALALTLLVYSAGSFGRAIGARGERAINHLLMIKLLMKHPSQDQSFQERLWETIEATKVFMAQPVLGVGPGHEFTIKRANHKVLTTYSIVDTPMEFPAKYGLAGIGILFIAGYALYAFIRSAIRGGDDSAPALALVGFGLFSFVRILVSSPFDDKGYSMGLLFLLALCVIDMKRASARAESPDRAIALQSET